MIIDTHAHLNFNAYKNDWDEVIKRCFKNNISIINVGSQYDTSKRAVEIAEKYEKDVYAAIGLHPIHLSSGIFKEKIDKEEIEFKTREEEFDKEKYLLLIRSKKVKAIGEIGLDYYYKPKTKIRINEFKERQRNALLKQIDFAQELDLPIIFHCRMAYNDLLDILKKKNNIKGVIHCFTGNKDELKEVLNMGFYIGFNGIIFKLNLDDIIKETPLERILVETDCPYLIPPMINVSRNEPVFIKYILEKITKIKNISFEKLAEITTENAKKLFKI
ncbi:MAG TPA: TatD family hydrolase [Candidatus Pacearchaeota archaeon]|nr:TatD family hydrolase [Candidatus Pacearchaeota archaeon]